ncbi:MAG: CPBP family intramembrane metalloprotease [Holophagaceae bacterium]|nr:CPBP family intramembrane metalloprotease [Holophagaceae bacterium]
MIAPNKHGQIFVGPKIFGFIILAYISLLLVGFLPAQESVLIWIKTGAIFSITWIYLKFEGNKLDSIGLKINLRFASELLIGAMFGIFIISISALFIWCCDGFSWVRNPQVTFGDLFFALIIFLALSMFEELLFRGYAFQRAITRLGIAKAQIFFGCLFVAAHWNNPGMSGSTRLWASLSIGLASLLLGLALIKTGSLALPIGIHLGWNWAQGSLLGFGVSGTASHGFFMPIFNDLPLWFTGGDFGIEASLPGAIVCLIVCIGLFIWKPKLPPFPFAPMIHGTSSHE